jgi:hypothetical protein
MAPERRRSTREDHCLRFTIGKNIFETRNGFSRRLLGQMDRICLAIICAGIILLVTALALQTPDAGALTIAMQQRVLPR